MCRDAHAPSSAALRAPWSGGVACGAAAFVGMHPDKSKLIKLCRISKNRCILRVSARASAYAKSAGRVDGCRRIWHGERFILILPVRRVAARQLSMSYADEASQALLRRVCVRRGYVSVGIFGSWRPRPKQGAAARKRKSGKYAIIRTGRLSRAGPYMPREVEAAGDLLAEAK